MFILKNDPNILQTDAKPDVKTITQHNSPYYQYQFYKQAGFLSPGGTPGNKHADETEKPAVEEDLYHDAPVMTVFTYMHYDHGQKQYFCQLIVGFDRILMYVYVYTETVFTAVTLTASFSEQIHSNPQQNTDYMILLLKY